MNLLPLLAVGIAVLSVSADAADTRIFTDISGRTITAEIVSVTAQTATLKLADGTTHTIAQERLTEADRKYLLSWKNVNLGAQAMPAQAAPARPAAKSSFKLDWTSERLSKKLRPTDTTPTDLNGLYEEWVCHFKVTNLSREPLANVRVDYIVHSKMKWRIPAEKAVKGSLTIPSIGGFQSLSVDTDSLTMSGRAFKRGNTITGKASDSAELHVEKIEGVEVTLFLDDTEVHRYVSPGIRSSVPKAGEAR